MLPMLGSAPAALRFGGQYLYWGLDLSRVDPTGFGQPRAFPRLPRALLVYCSADDYADVQSWAASTWASTFRPRRIEVGVSSTPGNFPFLRGIPTEGIVSTDRTDTFWTPVQTTSVFPANLVFGGRVMIATITKYRVAWQPDNGTGLMNALSDYVVYRTNAPSPAPSGFDEYPDPADPPGFPYAGFTVFASNAALHVAGLSSVAYRFRKFLHVFYQGDEEADPISAPDGTDSSIVPESAMTALMGGSPYLARKPYTAGDLSGVLSTIATDAVNFLASGDSS